MLSSVECHPSPEPRPCVYTVPIVLRIPITLIPEVIGTRPECKYFENGHRGEAESVPEKEPAPV